MAQWNVVSGSNVQWEITRTGTPNDLEFQELAMRSGLAGCIKCATV